MPQEQLFFETPDSRDQTLSVDAPKYDTKWTAIGFDDDSDVEALVILTAPATIKGLIFQNADIAPRSDCPGTWDVTAHYTRKQPGTPGTMTVEVDLSGEQAKITHSYGSEYFPATVASFEDGTDELEIGEGDDEEDEEDDEGPFLPTIHLKNAILLRDRGGKVEAEGIEELFPAMSFTVTRYFGTDTDGTPFPMPANFIQTLMDKTGHIDIDSITITIQGQNFAWDPGEVLFLGASCKLGSDDHVAVPMKFKFSPNKTNVRLGGVQHSKKGWHFAWPYCEEKDVEITVGEGDDETTVSFVISQVRQICVEQTKHETQLRELFGLEPQDDGN